MSPNEIGVAQHRYTLARALKEWTLYSRVRSFQGFYALKYMDDCIENKVTATVVKNIWELINHCSYPEDDA